MNLQHTLKAIVSESAFCKTHPNSHIGRRTDGSWYTLCVSGYRKLKSGEMSNCKIIVETQNKGGEDQNSLS